MWINRTIEAEIVDLVKHYPVIMITGPRQSGKTSLAKKLFSNYNYFSLENPDLRFLFEQDPKSFFDRFENGAIIDEFQRFPDLLSYIQGIVDEKQNPGQFILTGSNNIQMLQNITQSLAGRVALVKLLPLSIYELEQSNIKLNSDELLLHGFYPRILATQMDPNKAYRNYFETYIERDIRQLINLKDLNHFQKFIRLCAGRIGQIFNANSLAGEVGVSSVTIANWLNALQASYIVFMLQPWSANINKRIIKTPKLYFYDVGLANYLLGNETERHVASHPLRGSLFENLVIVDMLKNRFNKGKENNLYFYRDNHGNEVDIISKNANDLDIYEVKSASTFHESYIKSLIYFKKISKTSIHSSTIIYSGELELNYKGNQVINYKNL
jgi:predicted AAA+ superfamily ATPase